MARSGNQRKHESRNPLQRALIGWFHQQVVDLVHRVAPRTLLDVGCGEGYVLEALVQGEVGAELCGADISEPALQDARRRLGARARLEACDALALAERGQTFDLVMMLEVLEHLPEPQRMLPVLERLTHRHVLLSVPWEPLFRGLNFMRGKNLAAWGNDPEHVNHWSRPGFFAFVEQRFRILEAPLVAPWTLVLAERRGV